MLAGAAQPATSALPGRPLRIAYSSAAAAPGARVAPPVRAGLEAAAAALRSAGHDLVRAKPPIPANLFQIVAAAGGENMIISLAAELERLRPWPQLAPLAAPKLRRAGA